MALDDLKSLGTSLESGFETASDVYGTVQDVDEALGLGIVPGAGSGGSATQSWMIDPSKFKANQNAFNGAHSILKFQKNVVARGGGIDEIAKIARLPATAGLAPTGTAISSLDKIGQHRMLLNRYAIALANYRNSPLQLYTARQAILNERNALGFPQMGRAPYTGPNNPCSNANMTPDGYRSALTNEPCPPHPVVTDNLNDTRPSMKPMNDAIARLMAVAQGVIPESGVAGSPGEDPLASMAHVSATPSTIPAEECFDRSAYQSPDARLNCISGYESSNPGTIDQLLRTHRPWEAGMVEGKAIQLAPGMKSGQRYLVMGGTPPGFGVSLKVAIGGALAVLGGAYWYLYKTKRGQKFRKRNLKMLK